MAESEVDVGVKMQGVTVGLASPRSRGQVAGVWTKIKILLSTGLFPYF